jgi:hypothetical protein
MYQYRLWVRLNSQQSTYVSIYASSDYDAKMIGEAQYGSGNVLNWTRING